MKIRAWISAQRLACLATALLLQACGTSPPTRYWALSEPAATTVEKTGHALVALGPLMLADYLQRPQIVVRADDERLKIAEFERWAEAPDRAIARWLARDVDARLAVATVVEATALAATPDYRLRGQVAQWDVDARSNAVLVVQWEVVDRDGQSVVAMHSSRYAIPVARADDYADVVRGLNGTLAAFGDEIIAELGRTVAAH